MSGLEAEPGPGRAETQPGRPAGFAGRAQPAPSPSFACYLSQSKECKCTNMGAQIVFRYYDFNMKP